MRALALGLAIACTGCGYRLAHGSAPTPQAVAIAPCLDLSPDRALQAAAEAGARAELARMGAVADASARRTICIQIRRADELPEAIGSGAASAPLARSIRVLVTGSGDLTEDGRSIARTDSLESSEVVAVPSSAAAMEVLRDEASRIASRRLGEAVVRALMGRPDPAPP